MSLIADILGGRPLIHCMYCAILGLILTADLLICKQAYRLLLL